MIKCFSLIPLLSIHLSLSPGTCPWISCQKPSRAGWFPPAQHCQGGRTEATPFCHSAGCSLAVRKEHPTAGNTLPDLSSCTLASGMLGVDTQKALKGCTSFQHKEWQPCIDDLHGWVLTNIFLCFSTVPETHRLPAGIRFPSQKLWSPGPPVLHPAPVSFVAGQTHASWMQ